MDHFYLVLFQLKYLRRVRKGMGYFMYKKPNLHSLVQNQGWKQQNNVSNFFKLTKEAPERRHSRCYVVFIVTFEQILCIVTVFTLFKQINAGWEVYKRPDLNDFAKFRWSHAIVGLVPSCLRGSEKFFCGYFVGSEYFLMGISWVSNSFSWVFRGFKIFSRGYFVGPKFSPVGILRVKDFFSWLFPGPKILWFSINFSKKQKETYDWGILSGSVK